MESQENEKLDVHTGDVVRWGDNKDIGVVKEIRLIDKAEFVHKFLGQADKVMLRIYMQSGTALVWPHQHEILKVGPHEAKEFKARFKSEHPTQKG